MGCGKSTLAPSLSERLLGYSCLDTDEIIFDQEGQGHTSLGDLIEQKGMGAFRHFEYRVVKFLVSKMPRALVAMGGGSLNEKTLPLFARPNLIVVWLRVDFSLCLRRIQSIPGRPLLKKSVAELEELYHERETYYRKAHLTVDLNGAKSVAEASAEVAKQIGGKISCGDGQRLLR